MCSEGKIETKLLADDIEHCFEDLDPYEADLGPEDSEDSDTDSAVATINGLSTRMEAQERAIEYDDRDSIKRLRGRPRFLENFLGSRRCPAQICPRLHRP